MGKSRVKRNVKPKARAAKAGGAGKGFPPGWGFFFYLLGALLLLAGQLFFFHKPIQLAGGILFSIAGAAVLYSRWRGWLSEKRIHASFLKRKAQGGPFLPFPFF